VVEVKLLGPVGASFDGVSVRLRGPKQRALLAMLALAGNTVVSRDRLIEGLWGLAPSLGVEHALDAQVSSLRQTLAGVGGLEIERRNPGYRVVLSPESVDVRRFDQLVSVGRGLMAQGDPAKAAAILAEALELWHGPALADVQDAPFAAAAAQDLERRRVDALEERVDADLARGCGGELVGDLEVLVREHPFRERLLAALALALYRDGQQARALEVIASARREFAAELGLRPGASLAELESRILNHDPDLMPRGRAASVTSEMARLSSRPRTVQWLTVAVAGLLIVGVLVARGLGVPGHRSASFARGAEGTVLAEAALAGVDLYSGRRGPLVPLSSRPSAVALGAAGVWVSESSEDQVALINPDNNSVLAALAVPGGPGGLTVGDGAVFVAETLAGSVARIDEESRQITQTIQIGGVPSAVAFADHRLWVADQNGRRVVSIDPGTGKTQHSVPLPDRPTALAADATGVWAASHDANTVTLIDPRSGSVEAIARVGGGPSALAIAAGSVWVANNDDATVSRLDLRSGRVVATIPVNSGPSAVTFAAGAMWVAGEHAGTLARIDPAKDAVTREVSVPGAPVALAQRGRRLWIASGATADRRGGTMRLLASHAPQTIDPGFHFEFLPPTMLGLVHDGLVTFDHTSGPEGLRLVPDLAVAIPPPSATATAFTFRLRPGIRYSTGQPVRAEDFRRSFRRLLIGGSGGAQYFGEILGAGHCRSAPDRCTLHRGVVDNNALGTVTFHLASPDPDFLFRLALTAAAPVPPSTPVQDMKMTPIPGTGPYVIAHADVHQIRMVRNPHFHEWSYAAQPTGNPDSIVWHFGKSQRAQVAAVRNGEADWTFQGIPADELTDVRNHDYSRLHVSDQPQTDFLFLKTLVPPFNHVLARRALNLAIDRGRIAAAYGGTDVAAPTCQMLPPGETARVPFCPWTRNPSPQGTWSAPDLARARNFVARSGTHGSTVTVLGNSDDPRPSKVASRAAAAALQRLGYHVHLTFLTRKQYLQLPPDQQAAFDVYPFAWYADFPSPATFFQSLLPSRPIPGKPGQYEQVLVQQIDHALHREAQGHGDAVALWSAIDRRATREAFTVPLVNPRTVELTSKRLRGYEYNPLWGFLPAQASITN